MFSVALIGLVQRAERGFAVRLLAARGEDRAVLAVRDGDLLAVRQRDRRKLRVGRRERPVGVVRRRGQPARERHQPLAGLVEHVLLLAVQVLDREAVDAQAAPSCSIQPRTVSSGICSSSGLNHDSACCQPREQDLHLLPLRVDGVVALVLVVLQRREIPDAVGELAELFGEPERRRAACRARRRACPSARRSARCPPRAACRRPPTPPSSGKMSVQVPLEPIGDLVAAPAADLRRLGRGDVGSDRTGHEGASLHYTKGGRGRLRTRGRALASLA